ncbi:MAG: hypothetical protein K2O98_15340 [Lachnospiraceae bacterium]|nr:hypothetical protein [Lachnospiraceae bacterium]
MPKIKQILPTNLPQIQVNEMRIDNLFLLEDDSIAIIDYESDVKWEKLLEEGRKEGLILSGKIFRVVRECSDLTNERIAEEVGCSVEEVESTRKIFDI